MDTFIIHNVNTRRERVQAFRKEGHDLRKVSTDRARAQGRGSWKESEALVHG